MDNKETLKTYYETGDKPTQEQFEKLIYACVGTLEKTDDLPVATSAQENVIYQIGRAFYQCKVLSGIYGWQYIGSLGADGKVRYDADDVDGDYLSNRMKAGNDMDVNEGTGADENKAIISLKEITLEAPTATDTPIIAQNRITVLLQNLLNLWKGLYDGKLGYLQVVFSYSGETLTSTKTVAEILAAINANKQIIAYYSGIAGFITENIIVGSDMVVFNFLASTLMVTITGDGSGETDSWTLVEEDIEKTSNKVSAWAVTPNDTNYPSEKLVKDSLDDKQAALGFTPENVANKETSALDTSTSKYPCNNVVNTALGTKVTANAGITAATKTKITYDAKGLVTGGADATTADIADSTNKRYCTDAEKTVISNTSNTNTGDQDATDFDIKDLTDSTSLRSTWSGKQDALTFGIANTNALKVDDASAADNEYAKLTANGIEGRSYTEVKQDLDLEIGTDVAAQIHAIQHAVGGTDSVFPTDPNADKYLKFNNTSNALEWADVGIGDMILDEVQSVTGLKTFDSTKIAIKGSSTGKNIIASANTGATNYTHTLQAETGVIAHKTDIPTNVSNIKFFDSIALNSLPSSGIWQTAYGNGYVVGIKNNSSSAFYSDVLRTNGALNSVSLPSSQLWCHVFFGGNIFVALSGGVNAAKSINNGATWSALTLPAGTWNNGCYGELNGVGYYVIVGENGTLIYSSDLTNWETGTLPTASTYTVPKIIFLEDRFIILYKQDSIAYTLNLTSYTDVSLPTSYDYISQYNYRGSSDFDYNGVGIILLKQSSNLCGISINKGVSFSSRTMQKNRNWTGIIGGGSSIIFLSNNDYPNISFDGGTTFTSEITGISYYLTGCYGNNKYFLLTTETFAIMSERALVDENGNIVRISGDFIGTDNKRSGLIRNNVNENIIELAAKKEKVKYDASDTTAGYIADKFVAGTGISLAEGTGANENKLVITSTGAGSGDMLASTYDPNNVNGDAFDMDNMAEGDTNKILTATERTKISNSLTYFTLTYYQAKPATCTTGETCFDTSNGKIYTATDTDTWDAGVAASTSVIYKWKGKSYQYVLGTELVRLDNLSPNVVVLSDTVGTAISAISSYSVNTKLFCQLNNTATTRAITIAAPTNDACCELTFENNTASAITITFPNSSSIVNYPYSTSGIIISAGLRRTISWEMTGEEGSTDMNIFWGDEQTAVS